MKQAAIFSALTGLRHSDIKKLTWQEIEYIEGDGYFIKFIQQKSKGAEMMPISEQAYALLGKPKDASIKIFENLKYSAYENQNLKDWIINAGINKDTRSAFSKLRFSSCLIFCLPDDSDIELQLKL